MGGTILQRRKRFFRQVLGLNPTAYWRLNDLANVPSANAYDAAILARGDTTHYWELGEASGIAAANSVSGAANPGVINGNPTLGVEGPLIGSSDKAIDLDGTGDFVSVAYAAALNPALFTVSVWFNPDGTATGRLVSSRANYTTVFQGYEIYVNGTGKVEAFFGRNAGASATTIASTNNVVAGQWTHAAVTWDGSTARLFVNGAEVASSALTGGFTANASLPLFIGTNNPGTGAFSGVVSKVSLHNAALTAAEIGDLFVLGRPVVDAMGSYAGGMIDAPVSASGAVTGDSDAAFDFDGSNDAVVVPYKAALNAATFSVTGWVYRDVDTGGNEIILRSRNSGNTLGHAFYIGSTDKLTLSLGDGAGTSDAATSATSLATGTWYHVAATYDGTTARLYINGVADGSGADGYSVNTSGPTTIGQQISGANRFNGKIDELTYHGSRVLTADEIATLYAAR